MEGWFVVHFGLEGFSCSLGDGLFHLGLEGWSVSLGLGGLVCFTWVCRACLFYYGFGGFVCFTWAWRVRVFVEG